MTDAELHAWWADLGIVIAALRRIDQGSIADRLVAAVGAGATSSEILGAVGVILREHRGLRRAVGSDAGRSWDAVMADVHRAFPGRRLRSWIAGLGGR